MSSTAGFVLVPLLVATALPGCLGGREAPANVPPELTGVTAVPASGSAWVNFTVAGAGTTSTVAYWSTDGSVSERRASAGPGFKSVLLPFLSGSTTYHGEVRTENSTGRQRHVFSFQTRPDPYAWAQGPGPWIRPGVGIDAGPCTLGFVFRDATNATLYAATAGHCVTEVGQRVALEESPGAAGGAPFGAVAAFEREGADYALIRIDEAARANVTPQVRLLTGPSGAYVARPPLVGETVCLVGRDDADLRDSARRRCGQGRELATSPEYRELRYEVETEPGDSGSPVLLSSTGEAVAIHVAANPLYRGIGLSVESLLQRAEARWDLDLAVASAPYGRGQG